MRKKIGIFLLIIMLVTSTMFVFQTKKVNATGKTIGDWWNNDWSYRKLITINSLQVDSTLSNFPVLISLASDSDLAAHAQPDGDDIAFVLDSDNTQLNHEIETYNGTTGELVCWVNVTSLSNTVDTKVWMYYGNSDCSSQQNVAGTWESSFLAVWHLNQETGNYTDSTNNFNNGTLIDNGDPCNRSASGKIGYCIDFNNKDDNDSINFGTSSVLNPGTGEYMMEAWTRRDGDTDTSGSGVMDRYGGSGLAYWDFRCPSSNGKFSVYFRDDANHAVGSSSVETGNQSVWYYHAATLTRDAGGYLRLYINGSNVASVSSSTLGDINPSGKVFYVGQVSNDPNSAYFDGCIDEVRVSNVARDASWINTSYNTMSNPSSFISVGSEEMQLKIIVSDPYPADGAIDVELIPIMSISVSHSLSNQMNITWKWNNSGSWDVFGINYSVFNGTYNQVNMNFSSNQTTYEWEVEVDDGIGNWNNKTYSFTTVKGDIVPPTVNFITPQLGFIYIYFLVVQLRLRILPATSTLIISKLDIEVDAKDNIGINWVKIYINDVLRATISEPPYIWNWNEFTTFDIYKIKAVASDLSGNQKSADIEVYKIQLFEYG